MTQTPTKIIYMRIPANLYDKLTARAEADRRSINMTARILLELALAEQSFASER